MAVTLPIYTFTPIVPYTPVWTDPATVAEFEGTPLTARATALERAFWRAAIRHRFTETNRAAFIAFWIARRGAVGLFYFRCRIEYARTSIALGSSSGGQVNFPIPDGDPYGGDFPIDDAHAILYSDGSPIAKTVDTDGRKFVASSAPGAGHVITADYWYYRRVRFEGEEMPMPHPAYGTTEVSVGLKEETA